MTETMEVVLRLIVWTGIVVFTWSVSASLESIAKSLNRPR